MSVSKKNCLVVRAQECVFLDSATLGFDCLSCQNIAHLCSNCEIAQYVVFVPPFVVYVSSCGTAAAVEVFCATSPFLAMKLTKKVAISSSPAFILLWDCISHCEAIRVACQLRIRVESHEHIVLRKPFPKTCLSLPVLLRTARMEVACVQDVLI